MCASVCVCVCKRVYIWFVNVCVQLCIYMSVHPSFSCSCCSRFEAEEARKLRVAVGSFLDLITLTIDTMDQFG